MANYRRSVPGDPLTKRQSQILGFIVEMIVTEGWAPTLREIRDRFTLGSTNAANDHLRALEKKGHIRRAAMKSRAIQVLRP